MTKTSTDSATIRRSQLKSLVAFIEVEYQHQKMQGAQRALAVRGDVDAARKTLEEFRLRFLDLGAQRMVPKSADELDLLITSRRLIDRLLEQPDAALGIALGFQRLRKTPERMLTDRVIYFAVEHAQTGMGEWRTVEDACTMVAAACGRLQKLFPMELNAENIQKVHDRVAAADPMGPGLQA